MNKYAKQITTQGLEVNNWCDGVEQAIAVMLDLAGVKSATITVDGRKHKVTTKCLEEYFVAYEAVKQGLLWHSEANNSYSYRAGDLTAVANDNLGQLQRDGLLTSNPVLNLYYVIR